ncbi:MAG: RecQ family ATP-dependent DNA helicase [Bacteroidales bacterium]|nr:RecQ family ATP-dependent DNA helicase [Candidatus Colimorpha pelethequi]
MRQLLKKYWGFDDFRPLQEEVISSIIQGRDTLVLLPTGGGKSLCYQLPAIYMDGLCIVVSPLIALMKEQVQKLLDRNIKAACIVSGMNQYEQELVLNKCLYGGIKLLYVSPERLKQRMFIDHLRQMKVSMIAVDEAHCISQWGYDFRPAYLEIASIRQWHPQAPVLALTATATKDVIADIQEKLMFREGKVFRQSFFRSNLAYMVFKEEDKIGRLLRIIKNVKGCGVVYVRNRRRTQDVAHVLNAEGVSATYYHAGLSSQQRDERQGMWMSNQVSVMVATNAFGMGIDKPDVRFVVHLDIPSSIEAYFQEAGRGGRDGEKSYAVMLYDQSDIARLDASVDESYPPIKTIQNVYRGLCNFYNIPIGSGEDSSFPFDLEQICNVYGFAPLECFNSIAMLEREGLLSLPDADNAVSRLMIISGKEELYKFQVETPRYEPLLQLLLRMYGGLFSDFVEISEKQLAKRLYLDETTVQNMLSRLDTLQLVSYKKRSSQTQIVFSASRVDAKDLHFVGSQYSQLKSSMEARVKAIKRYVMQSDSCRSQMLLAYFDEEAGRCGMCDYCLGGATVKNADAKRIEGKVVEVLASRKMTIKDLMMVLMSDSDIHLHDEEKLCSFIRCLIDERKIGVDKDFNLFV